MLPVLSHLEKVFGSLIHHGLLALGIFPALLLPWHCDSLGRAQQHPQARAGSLCSLQGFLCHFTLGSEQTRDHPRDHPAKIPVLISLPSPKPNGKGRARPHWGQQQIQNAGGILQPEIHARAAGGTEAAQSPFTWLQKPQESAKTESVLGFGGSWEHQQLHQTPVTLRVQSPAGRDLDVPSGGFYTGLEVLMPNECCGCCLPWQEGRNTRLKGERRNFIAVSAV